MKTLSACIVVLASLVSSYAYAEVYTFTAPNFTTANGSYTTAMKVTGTLITSSPIPPNSAAFDISGILTSWSFNDGLQTINNVNGTLNPNYPPQFTTDSGGNITAASFWVFTTPLGTAVAQTDDTIFIVGNFAQVVTDAPCAFVVGGFCNQWSVPVNVASVHAVAVWAVLPAPTPVPTMSQWSLILLTMLLGLAGFAYLRKAVIGLVKIPTPLMAATPWLGLWLH